MKKRLCSAVLALALCLALPFPALAAEEAGQKDNVSSAPSLEAEGTTFVDVAPGDWFAPYVDVCVEAGLMKGVGGGRFDPQGTMTMAEAVTIAGRIRHIKKGGDGNLPHAPEEWGRMTLTFADGECFSCYRGSPNYGQPEECWYRGGRTSSLLYFFRPDGWDGRDFQRVTLTGWTSNTPLHGRAEVVNNTGAILRFEPDQFTGAFDTLLRDTPETPPSKWYRDADYYLLTQGLGLSCDERFAQRRWLVEALDAVLEEGDLPAINHIDDYPDAGASRYYNGERERALKFYNAGILTGTDAVGSFSPDGYLTRAEMAAMAARILKPELRLEFSPEKPVFQSYTLTPVDPGLEPDRFSTELLSSALLLIRRQDGEGRETGQSILRADGRVLDLPDGATLSQYPGPHSSQEEYPLLVLGREDMTMPGGSVHGVFDPLTGEMVLPFGPYAGYGGHPGAGNCAAVGGGRLILTKEAAWDNGTWTPTLLRDDKGQVLCELPPERESINVAWDRLNEGLAPALDWSSGLSGYVDVEGNWVIQPQFSHSYAGFSQGRAVVCRKDEEDDRRWRYSVIDTQGREVLSCEDVLTQRGPGLYRAEPVGGIGYWLREDGSTFRNGYLNFDGYLLNGYFSLGDRYLDENFQYATPDVFDWTGPISSRGSGFVGMDGKVYRIQFEK